jgi:hypothetical protein
MPVRTVLIPSLVVVLAVVLLWWLLIGARASHTAAPPPQPLNPPTAPLRVYHLGHSLVGRDMPAMLAQLAGAGHGHESQLGWGAALRDHWDKGRAINGFDTENAHDRFRPAKEALQSGDYDAVVLTEMVELRDAIRYFDSPRYLARWAALAHKARPDTRVYLYETWHKLDDPDGWLTRLDADLADLWEGKLLLPAMAETGAQIHVIPAGQVMAAFVRRVDAAGGIGGITTREDLFARDADGGTDPIHLNDAGAYLVALTHFAVLYHRSPVGLPYQLRRADGNPADAVSPEAAQVMQETVWAVVTAYPRTGVSQ